MNLLKRPRPSLLKYLRNYWFSHLGSLILIIFLEATSILFVASCGTTENDRDEFLEIVVLQELYFLENNFSKEECDNFRCNNQIVEIIKNKYPEVSDDVLKHCEKLRKERSSTYDR